MNTVYLLIGSNIDPVENTCRALTLIRSLVEITAVSHSWETESIGSPGPNYINLALKVATEFDRTAMKEKVVQPIERALGRVRSENKNAPRTIDIDILVFNDEIVEPHLWERPYEALPLADLLPDLSQPITNVKLHAIAEQLLKSSRLFVRDDLHFL